MSVPSRFCSPLPRLCFTSYAVRSARVKPSCAVTKLRLASGPRSAANVFDEPASRVANRPMPLPAVPV